MDIKIIIVSFISYVLGALINEHIFHREKKVKRVVFQYQIDRKFSLYFLRYWWSQKHHHILKVIKRV